ncbi:hypothetical protein ACOSQ4_021197 [Xanthoceras sorbifolium]
MPETRSGHSYNMLGQGSPIPIPPNPLSDPNTNITQTSTSFQQQIDQLSQTMNAALHRREGIGDSDEDEEEVQMGGVRPRETRNVQRQPREARGNVLDEVTKQLKIEVSDFVGKLDLPEDRKVRFVKFKLKGSARVWWSSIEERLRRTLQAPIIKWEDMKEKLETKYLPITYEQLVYEDMLLWSQGTKLLVDQYTERFQD